MVETVEAAKQSYLGCSVNGSQRDRREAAMTMKSLMDVSGRRPQQFVHRWDEYRFGLQNCTKVGAGHRNCHERARQLKFLIDSAARGPLGIKSKDPVAPKTLGGVRSFIPDIGPPSQDNNITQR